MTAKQLLSGNEAIARGAFDGGVGAAEPGGDPVGCSASEPARSTAQRDPAPVDGLTVGQLGCQVATGAGAGADQHRTSEGAAAGDGAEGTSEGDVAR